MQPIILNSSCLFSKWGFADGDILDDYMYEQFKFEPPKGGPWDDNLGLEHCILHRLITDHLLPILPPGFELYMLCSIHNPVRAGDDMKDPERHVIVTFEQFKVAAQQVILGE